MYAKSVIKQITLILLFIQYFATSVRVSIIHGHGNDDDYTSITQSKYCCNSIIDINV